MAQKVCNAISLVCEAQQMHQSVLHERIKQFSKLAQAVEEINAMQQTVLMLNVGGHVHHLSKHSATRHRDSFFGALFSDAFNPKDQTCTFIDRDGETFSLVATYLRHETHFIDIRNKKRVTQECAFYCLPPPIAPPHIVWLAHQKDPPLVYFSTECGESYYDSVTLPPFVLNDMWDVACNSSALYAVHRSAIMEYQYSAANWIEHSLTCKTPGTGNNIYATNFALFAVVWLTGVHVMELDGRWKWKAHNLQHARLFAATNDVFIASTYDAVFVYDNKLHCFQEIFMASVAPIYWILATKTFMYNRTDDGVSVCKIGEFVWKEIRVTKNYLLAGKAVELNNALHRVTAGYHQRCFIFSDGSLGDFEQVSSFDYTNSSILGIRCE